MTNECEPEAMPNDWHFDPYRFPRSEALKGIVADVTGQLMRFEGYYGLRQRKRKAADQETFERTIGALVADLAHRHDVAPGEWICVPCSKTVLGHGGRYRAAALNKNLPTILKRLSAPEMDFVEYVKGEPSPFNKGRRSTIRPGRRLLDRFEEHDIGIGDVGRTKTDEVIILRAPKKRRKETAKMIDYTDTRQTIAWREEIRTINEWLGQADIDFDEYYAKEGMPVDVTDRRLRRIFSNGELGFGGRLWGGFWQPLGKEVRPKGITIDGEDVVTLDYDQAGLRIAYGLVGAPLPALADLYGVPGLEDHRSAVKTLLSAMLANDKPFVRFPNGLGNAFPEEMRVDDAVSSITLAHAPIEELFFTEAWGKIFFLESEIMIDVLLALRDEGTVGLPVHDAVVVPASAQPRAKEIMIDVFESHTGVPAAVSLEGGSTTTSGILHQGLPKVSQGLAG